MQFDRRTVFVGVAASATGVANAQTSANVRHHGVLLRTPDLDAALAFYCDGLGFPMSEFQPRLGWTRLASNLPIYLETTTSTRLHGPEIASAALTLRSNNLDASMPNIRAARGRIISETPYDVAVGRAIHFADPAGIIHHLLQPNGETPLFAEPSVYNCGFDVPVSAIAPTRTLLEQGLGFVPMTERYYPPSIPYLEADRSFAFMLHHHQPSEPDMRPRENARADDLGAWQVFTADDLRTASNAAIQAGATALDRGPQRFPMGRRRSFLTPGGGPFEIWSWA